MQATLPASATPPGEPVGAKAPPTHPKTNYLYVIGLTGVAAIGGLLFGFDSGVVNGTVAALAAAFGTKAAATGFAVASVLLGCAFGAFGAGALANRIGRRPTMIIDAVLFLGSAFATGAAGSVGIFIGSRIVAGLAIGAASVLAPMYIAEVAPAHLRGPARLDATVGDCPRLVLRIPQQRYYCQNLRRRGGDFLAGGVRLALDVLGGGAAGGRVSAGHTAHS